MLSYAILCYLVLSGKLQESFFKILDPNKVMFSLATRTTLEIQNVPTRIM